MSITRGWFRFGLRTLLVITTMVCLWLGRTTYLAHQRATALAAIRNLSGHVLLADRPRPWTVLALSQELWGEEYVAVGY